MDSSPLRLVAGSRPPYYVFDVLSSAGIVHGVFTRRGGVSAPPFDSLNVSSSTDDAAESVSSNRDRVMAALGRPRGGLVMAGLVHGTTVAAVTRSESGQDLAGGGRYIPGVDALVSADPDVTLLLTAADCAHVLLADHERGVVALAHAGWRGSVRGVVGATVAALRDGFGCRPAALRAAVGPCLGPCCAQFSDPEKELPAWCAPYVRGRYVDLWAMNEALLVEAGLNRRNVAVAAVCTKCRRDEFFSHRGDSGRTGRFAAAIGLR